MAGNARETNKAGTVELTEQDLEKVGGGSARLTSTFANKSKSSNEVAVEELTIAHEAIVRTK